MNFLTIALAAGILTGQILGTDGKGIKNVAVSDGHQVVQTDARGRYRIKSSMPEGYVFISIPSGYEVPSSGLLPQFYTTQKKNARFILKEVDQTEYKVVMLTDLHLTGDKTDNDLAQFHTWYKPALCRAVKAMKGPVYTFCLGDMCTNSKWYKNGFGYSEYLKEMEGYPTPLFNIMGNHDNDEKCEGTAKEWEYLAEQKYKDTFGPKYYSLNIGGVHYLMLDNIITNGPKAKDNNAKHFVGKFSYTYAFDSAQLEWVRRDMAFVPDGTPVVVCTHVPLVRDGKLEVSNGPELLELLKGHKVDIFSGHFHTTRNETVIPGVTQHLVASGSGVSWKLNDIQAPIVCDDGTPAGWQTVSVKDGKLSWQFQSCYRSVDESQCNVYDYDNGEFVINVFNWDSNWKVQAYSDGSEIVLQQDTLLDRTYVSIRKQTKMLLKRPKAFLPEYAPHFFRGRADGKLDIVLTDPFGNEYRANAGTCAFPQWGMSSVTVFEKGEEGYDTFRIPSIIRAADGSLLAFAEGRRNDAGDTGNIDLVQKRSSDGGLTWGPLQVIWDDADNVCGNPSPVVDRTTGTIVLALTWNNGRDKESDIHSRKSIDTRRVFCMTSVDNGHNWSKPVDITSQTKRPEWTWYATGPCHAAQLASGRIVVPCNHGVFNDGPSGTASHIIYSDDCGRTWAIGAEETVGNESTLAIRKDGKILLNMRRWKGADEQPYRLTGLVSADGLAKENEPAYCDYLPCPRCQGSMMNAGGKLYFSNPYSLKGRHDMTLQSSTDDGKTWRIEALLPGKKAAYSDIVELPYAIGVLYETGDDSPYERIVFVQVKL